MLRIRYAFADTDGHWTAVSRSSDWSLPSRAATISRAEVGRADNHSSWQLSPTKGEARMKRFHTAWFLAILLLVAAAGRSQSRDDAQNQPRTAHVARRAHAATRPRQRSQRNQRLSRRRLPLRRLSEPRPPAAAMANLPTAIMATTKPCVGVPMLSGQADIDARPQGTNFCLSGMHHWTLTPKSNNTMSVHPALCSTATVGR